MNSKKKLQKHIEKKPNINDLIEQIADIEIMIEQLKIMFHISAENIKTIQEKQFKKILQRIIDNEKENKNGG